VIVWQALDQLGVDSGLHGLALVALAIVYVVSGVVVQHRTLPPARLLEPIRAPIDAFARPLAHWTLVPRWALVLVVDVSILLADPLRAMNTWYLVAVIGLAMIAAVVLIEQRRQRILFWLNEWRLRLEAWE
jgi:hypothetical protein